MMRSVEMWAQQFDRTATAAAIVIALCACDDANKTQAPRKATTAASAAASAAAARETETPPGPCKASGIVPVELGSTQGHVYGFATDAHHVYYSSWQSLGSRGDLGKARKDGGGRINLTSLSLEPRSLVVDDKQVFFTLGIRLMSVSKDGSGAKVHAPTFSSQSIAADGAHVYGVPGDYGPYDRLIRVPKAGGATYELDVSERPESKLSPQGFSAIAVDATGIYVTDSSENRVLQFPLERAKPKVLATRQDKAYDLAIDDEFVYFTLALQGQLMKVPKKGGTPTKLGTGLVKNARIALGASDIFTTVAGKTEDDGQTVIKLPRAGGDPAPMATLPKGYEIEGIATDDKCVYWAARDPDSQRVAIMARAH
jgi:hypothetical protein